MTANILKFSWKNIWRNKRRTIFTLCAIAFGVMSIVFVKSYLRGILNSATDGIIKNQTGHIKIVHKEYLRLERILPKEYLVPGLIKLENGISRLPGIERIVEQIKFNVLVNRSNANEPAVAVGIRAVGENKYIDISTKIISGKYFEKTAVPGLDIIIGKGLAKKLGASLHDEILLVTTDINYSTYALPFKIIGIFETGYSSIDRHLLYLPLEKAWEMLDCRDAAHELLIFLTGPEKAIAAAAEIEKLTPPDSPGSPGAMGSPVSVDTGIRVIPWQKDDFIANFVPFSQEFLDRIFIVFMFIVALVILNTMLMTVMERSHEIGVLKALGFKDGEVVLEIFLESFFIGIIGSLAGALCGGAISAVFEKTGMNMAKMAGEGVWDKIDISVPFLTPVIYPDLTFAIIAGAILFGILASAGAALYPAFKSSKMSPVEAFRSKLRV